MEVIRVNTKINHERKNYPKIAGTFIYAGTLNSDGSYTKTGYPLTNIQGM